jgi:TrmH family RNA methyltransferase
MPDLEHSIDRLRRISSRQNARVKDLRRAFHDAAPNEHGEVAIEGMHLVEEAIRSGLRIATVLFSESAQDRAHKLIPQLPANCEILLLSDDVFASAVPTETPQGIAALIKVKTFSLDAAFLPEPALVVIGVGLQDPGNLGTIARSAEAFGATGLLLGERTVSSWNWKAIRASAGSMFRVPTTKVELLKALHDAKSRGVRVLATSSHKGTSISQADLRGPVALLIGNEGAGLPKDVLAQADELIVIPQSSRVESLNAGIAASVILYEAARQRNNQ